MSHFKKKIYSFVVFFYFETTTVKEYLVKEYITDRKTNIWTNPDFFFFIFLGRKCFPEFVCDDGIRWIFPTSISAKW